MEQLIEMVLQALRAAGIHCVRALDEETLPRLKDPGDSMVRGALYMLTPWMEPNTCFMGVRA